MGSDFAPFSVHFGKLRDTKIAKKIASVKIFIKIYSRRMRRKTKKDLSFIFLFSVYSPDYLLIARGVSAPVKESIT